MKNFYKDMKPYDMIFTWTYKDENIFVNIIRWFIRLFTKGGPDHVRLYMGGGKFTEFTYPKSRWGDVNEINFENNKIEIGRNNLIEDISIEEEMDLRKWCNDRMGKKYDIRELVWEHLLDELGIDFKDDSSNDKYVCSTYVKNAYDSIGRDLLPEEPLSSPQDLRESPKYYLVCKNF